MNFFSHLEIKPKSYFSLIFFTFGKAVISKFGSFILSSKFLNAINITLTLSAELFCILYLMIASVIVPHKVLISVWTCPFFL